MNLNERLERQIADAATRFGQTQMSVTPESVLVDFHQNTLLITLQNVTCPGERLYAQNKDAGNLLEQLYVEAFDATSSILQSEIEQLLDRKIQRSRISVDPESGDAVILITFADNARKDCKTMTENYAEILKSKLADDQYANLMALQNTKLHKFVAEAIELCKPESVFVCTDSPEDIARIRKMSIEQGEEISLAIDGHTIHFDGPNDQGRDKEVTRYLVKPGVNLGDNLNTIDREEGLAEVLGYLKDSMLGRTMFVRFFCLGPVNSDFSISGVQVTDSAYVCHSEDLLYRPGYEQFKRLGDSKDFFSVMHSAGRMENMVSVDVDKKRIYIDCDEEVVYSVNTQYAGNTVGFKKLSLRLAIVKADREGWLAEHMFVMGAQGPGRTTYFTGAFPSFCGKTSTSMIDGETIIGDDLAYLRKKHGVVHAANVECGIFGIIQNVNPEDDPIIWNALTTPGEVIFSNVLLADNNPHWLGSGREVPKSGINFTGEWFEGKTDEDGNAIPPAHKNARYTVKLDALANTDPKADDSEGVPVGGIIYGGRDSDTWVPVLQSFDWAHGVITMGAALESETTAATIGKEGVRSFQPMSNLDFVSIPLGRYVKNHLDFVSDLTVTPLIFAVNYFQKGKDVDYLTGMKDKKVWLQWMERRVNGEVEAISTPTGYIPLYEDLAKLFKQYLDLPYTREQYIEQFTLRIPENLRKLDRIENIYRTQVPDAPQELFDTLAAQRARLEKTAQEMGDYISPFDFDAVDVRWAD